MTRASSVCLLLALVTPVLHADPIRVETVAHSPVRAFNDEVKAAAAQRQLWVEHSEDVARRFIGDKPHAQLAPQELSGNAAFYLVRTPVTQDGVAEMVYLLELKRRARLWLMVEARIAWRCADSPIFSVRACPAEAVSTATPSH